MSFSYIPIFVNKNGKLHIIFKITQPPVIFDNVSLFSAEKLCAFDPL